MPIANYDLETAKWREEVLCQCATSPPDRYLAGSLVCQQKSRDYGRQGGEAGGHLFLGPSSLRVMPAWWVEQQLSI